MIHTNLLGKDTPLTKDRVTIGMRVRQIGTCTPEILYGTIVGADAEKELGGPRVWVRSVGNWHSSVPLSMLTDEPPLVEKCREHGRDHGFMVEYHITHTRVMPPSWTWGGPWRESAKSRNERKARMEDYYNEHLVSK